jgi:hypothetical protein
MVTGDRNLQEAKIRLCSHTQDLAWPLLVAQCAFVGSGSPGKEVDMSPKPVLTTAGHQGPLNLNLSSVHSEG